MEACGRLTGGPPLSFVPLGCNQASRLSTAELGPRQGEADLNSPDCESIAADLLAPATAPDPPPNPFLSGRLPPAHPVPARPRSRQLHTNQVLERALARHHKKRTSKRAPEPSPAGHSAPSSTGRSLSRARPLSSRARYLSVHFRSTRVRSRFII